MDPSKRIPFVEDEIYPSLDSKSIIIPILEDKKHPNLDENKYIPNLDVKLCCDCGRQETPTFG